MNEALTLGDIRTIVSSQQAWQTTNGGFYEGNLSCLASPTGCIPNYPPSAPTFLDARLASQVPKDGYVRAFVAGPRPAKIDPRVLSADHFAGYSPGSELVSRDPGRRGGQASGLGGESGGTGGANGDGDA